MFIDTKDPNYDKLIKMTEEEYDEYMCKTYPILFRERNLPMSETCMCWGFNISKGWYWILDHACAKLQAIGDKTGIWAIFGQIKEKFGTARFYHDADINNSTIVNTQEQKLWKCIINDIVNDAEIATVHTCADCGKDHYHEKIRIGGWVYDVCEKCLLKARPEMKKGVEKNNRLNNIIHTIGANISYFTDDELKTLEELNEKIAKRMENQHVPVCH